MDTETKPRAALLASLPFVKLLTLSLTAAVVLSLTAPAAEAVQVVQPSLTIDCSFTGYAGDLCEQTSRAWATRKNVNLKIERKKLTSTEKLRKYSKLLGAGSPELDVFGVDITWPAVFHKHLLELKNYFPEAATRYIPLYIQNNTVNGRLLAIPFNVSVGMMYYRTDLLKKYGRTPPETWEELADTAAFIQEKERAAGNRELWGYVFQAKAYEGLTCNFLEWVGSYQGYPFIDDHGKVRINTSNVQTALQTALSWMGKITPPEVLNFAERDSHEFYRQGKAVFLRAWPSAWAEISMVPTGVLLIPKGTSRGTHSSTLGGWSLAISKYSRHPQLAADLLQTLTGLEAQTQLALTGGGSPSLSILYDRPEILKAAPHHPLMMSLLRNALLRPSKITRADYPEVSQEIWTEVHKVLAREQTPLVAISKMHEKLEERSTRWKK
ncbi:MAG: ABC transporter substrate-binding protein [Methylotenera sp.]|nr:ABC transporter substrate-binding protein [Oligoflexia bacterium]